MSDKINLEGSYLSNVNVPLISIEQFKLEDKNKIIEFVLEVQKEFEIEIPLESQSDLQNLETAYECLWLAKSENKIIGTIACIKLLNGDLVWKKWYVHKDFRKHRIGGKLIRQLKDYAKKSKVTNIWIGSIKEKFTDAVEYYSKIGGLEIRKKDIDDALVDYPHNSVDNIFFKLPINLDPYQKYPTLPNYQQLQAMLSDKVEIDAQTLEISNQLRTKMLSMGIKLSMILDCVNSSFSLIIRQKINDLLEDIDRLNKLYSLTFEDNQVSGSQILIDNKNKDTIMSNAQDTVYLNIYLWGYSVESLKITKDRLRHNPLIFNRIWIDETQNIISKLEKTCILIKN